MARSRIKGEVPVDQMANAIRQTITDWSQDVADAVKMATVETAISAAADLRNSSPERTGAYAHDWTHKKMYEDRYRISEVVHNRKHYRLTHLLEYGHANRGGGRTPAYPHIGLAEERALRTLEEKVRQYINDIE